MKIVNPKMSNKISNSEPVLEIVAARGVWKSHIDEQYVLKGVDLIIHEGEFVTILGRSGAGKTTLLKLIGLLEKVNKGELIVFGRNAEELSEEDRAKMRLDRMGFVFQALNLVPHLTARENIEVPLWLKKVESSKRREKALELLSRFELGHLQGRLPSQMSLGEQQRVAVLRAIANDPQLLLADEPAAHLDEENATQLFKLMSDLNRGMGMCIISTTTSADEAEVASIRYSLSYGVLNRLQ